MRYLLSSLLLCPGLVCAEPSPKLPAERLRVPLISQATSYSCGPAALMAVLRYWKAYDGGEMELHPLLGTSPEEGTHPKSLKNVAAAHGLTARFEENMTLESLLEALKKGETALVDIQAWRRPGSTATWEETWEDGHYVVLVGEDADFLYVMDPSLSERYGYIPKDEFLSRWHDYENEEGQRREYRNAAVLVSGKERLERASRLQRVE